MNETSRIPFKRFPDFGKELRRPFEVHEICYDCAEFYGPGHGERGCDGWPADKPMKSKDRRRLLCLDFNRLPNVMPGEPSGQIFPESHMNGRKIPRERQDIPDAAPAQRVKHQSPVNVQTLTKRMCSCGRLLPQRRRFCDACRVVRKREAMEKFERRHPNRSHASSIRSQTPPGSRRKAPGSPPGVRQ